MVFAQNTKYQRIIGGNGDDNNYAIDRALDGGLIMTGYTTSYGSGGQDVYLIKTNALGQIEWSKAYGGKADESGWSVKATTDTGFIVCGTTNHLGNADGFIMKTDRNGNVQWSTTVTGDSTDDLYNIIQSKFRGYYAVGFSYHDSASNDMFVVKIDASGNVQWARHFGSLGDEEAYAVAEDDRGNILVTGMTNYDSITVGGRSQNWGDQDIAVAIADSNGNLKIMYNYGSTDRELGWDIKQYGRSQFAIAGWSNGLPFGDNDAIIAIIDTIGRFSNAYGFGTPGDERVFDLEVRPDNGFVLSGYMQAPGGDRDVMVLNVDSKGGLSSYAVYGGFDVDGHWPTDAIRARDGGYNVISSSKSFRNGKGYDFYMLRTNEVLVSGCNNKLEFFNVAQPSYTRYAFGKSQNFYSQDKLGFSTTNVNSFDSTLCCQLEARIADDTLKLCEGNSVFLGKEAVGGYIYSWTAIGNSFTSSQANPQVSPNTTTLYKLVVSTKDGVCKKDSATVLVQVFSTLKVDLVRDTTFCDRDTVTVSAYSGLNGYLWQGKTIQANTQSIQMYETDTVFFSVFDNNGCFYRDTLRTWKFPLPTFNLGKDTSICENLPITLTGPAGMTSYSWNLGQGTNQTFTTNVERKHSLTVVDKNKCVFSDTIQIFSNPASSFSLGADTTLCKGGTYTIPGPGALGSYIWNGTPNPNQNFVANKVGWYWCTAFNSFKCPWTDSIYIGERPVPTFSLGDSLNLCFGTTKTVNGPDKMASYNWSNGPKTKSQDISNPGSYRLTVTDSTGCSFADTLIVVQRFAPIIDLGNDTVICYGDSIRLNAGSGHVSYSWNNGKSTASIYVKEEGKYSVAVTNIYGCTGGDDVQVDTMKCGSGSISALDAGFKIFPNPAHDKLYLEYSGKLSNQWSIQITDLNGRILKSNANSFRLGEIYEVTVGEFAPGIYLLQLIHEKGIVNQRFVIE